MTTVATRTAELYDIEGFSIEFLDSNGQQLPAEMNGLASYRKEYEKRSRGSWTVNEWKKKFNKVYPAYGVNVLKEDGTIAAGQTLISTVRETYEGDE